jgi:hypothetical protein
MSPALGDTENNSSTALRESTIDFELRTTGSSAESDMPSDRVQREPMQAESVARGVARHTLGLILLLFVVFLWTASNFLGSVRKSFREAYFRGGC